ncbi:hypothetical protein B1C78_01930 [Thioalkalivibrio denitrificans]|uniref:Membrane-associated protein n=1 Tax=Thioalkalivibrio denitrificans TaxID=108003 RepID=A0A1V3NSU3_9GAMM|nr:hypothetical protein [Thioalkalivibrio denitrificans]OOG28101.1 hypothetical protein B1C78_01930 [Thioalkalivibrio denitrificans]
MIPVWFKAVYLAFVAVLVPAYTLEHGLLNFLWFSNLALMGGLLAALFESPRLASMMLVAVALLEMGWIIDFLGSLLLGGTPPLGFVDYMYDPEIALFVRLLSLYHLALPFVLFWIVWRLGYDQDAWKVWVVAGTGILILTFFLSSPDRNVNWVWGPGEPQDLISPYAWLGIVIAACAAAWWLTHRLVRIIMGRFDRVI